MTQSPLEKIMNPDSIAFLGGSSDPQKMGSQHALSILEDGFKGRFYPVHPNEKTVLGVKAYRSVAELPEIPDLAILIIPAEFVKGALEEFGKLGTRHAIIVTAGYREAGGEGARSEEELLEIAEKYGIRFLGPNCLGIINTETSLNTTLGPLMSEPGKLGFISQSGTYVAQSLSYLQDKGVRFSKAVSIGNESNIGIVDALEYLGNDEQTKVISIYTEGIKNIPKFLEVARKITPHKPVLVQYIGGSEAGARSGLSHTGAMASPGYLYDGLFKQAGIIRVDTVDDLYRMGWTLACQPILKGDRIGVITNSGGPGSCAADACEANGLKVPEFSSELKEQILQYLPERSPRGNPIDLGGFSMSVTTISKELPELVIKSGEVDGLIIHGVNSSGFVKVKHRHFKRVMDIPLDEFIGMVETDMQGTERMYLTHDIPISYSSYFWRDDSYVDLYLDNENAVFQSPEKAAMAMAFNNRYRKIRERATYKHPEIPEAVPEAVQMISNIAANGGKSIDEYSSKKLLELYGIPVTREKILSREDEVNAAAEEIGYPLVLKVCDPDILHKTEKGLVFLNLNDFDSTLKAFRTIQEKSGKDAKVIASKMIKGDREFVAGVTRDSVFGPCVLFGLGGIFTEALNDTTFRIAPLTMAEATEMLSDIRAQKLFEEFRGMEPVDKEALADLLQKLSFISVIHPEISEIDLNPVIIRDDKPVVVDALVILGEK